MTEKRRRRGKASTKDFSEENKSLKPQEKVLFQLWFNEKVRSGSIKFWQEKEIRLFFTQNGLAEQENPEKYEEMLKRY